MKISREAKIGFVAIVTVGLFYWGFNYLKGKNVFKRTGLYYTQYENLSGLKESASVLINGYKVGQVQDISIMKDSSRQLMVSFLVEKRMRIPSGTVAELASADIMGTRVINLLYTNSLTFLKSGDTLPSTIKIGIMDEIEPIKEQIEELTISMNSLLNGINEIMDPDTRNNIKNTLANLDKTSGKINQMVSSDGEIKSLLTQLNQVTKQINKATTELPTVMSNIQSITDTLSRIEIQNIMMSTKKALNSTSEILEKVNSGQGSVGLLVNNDSLYNNLTQATQNLAILLEDLEKNPKKYVHFSIFGGKDR